MVATYLVEELPPEEQIRMSVEEAGEKYDGHFIFFTNAEKKIEDGLWEEYGIPRVIALNQKVFYESGLWEKYNDNMIYGAHYTCSAFMAEDQIPPLLSF